MFYLQQDSNFQKTMSKTSTKEWNIDIDPIEIHKNIKWNIKKALILKNLKPKAKIKIRKSETKLQAFLYGIIHQLQSKYDEKNTHACECKR